MDIMALYDVLNCASMALIASEGGPPGTAGQAFMEATFRAPEAFPPGPLADALNLVLGAVGDAVSGVTA
jgi:hypothetical protein